MSSISPNRVIPEHLVIRSADDLLYSIGLCLQSMRKRPKRKTIYNPKLIAFVSWLHLWLRIASIWLPEDSQWLPLIGETGRYFGMKFHWNFYVCLINAFMIASQLNFFYAYKRGMSPTFVRVFRMMSGSVTPLSVGLSDPNQVSLDKLISSNKRIILFHINNIKFLLILFKLRSIFFVKHSPS